jgi:long-chain acyl-CoA synthetase
MTYEELDRESLRVSRALDAAGLRPGDCVAAMMENCLEYPVVLWGVLRSGMYLVTVSRYYTAHEANQLLADCEAGALVASASLQPALAGLEPGLCSRLRLAVGGPVDGFDSFEAEIARHPATPVRDPEPAGDWMLYSSGTTGRPLGIRRPLEDRTIEDPLPVCSVARDVYGIEPETVLLVPAPMHHAAPLCYAAATQAIGGTVVLMRRFDPERALEAVEHYSVTVGQWVPSMFVRILKLPKERRLTADLSTQVRAMHGAAPCPPEVKRAMIEWWGPILFEYYGSTEFAGLTACDSSEWEARPGTVGRAKLGTLHICDEAGDELPIGSSGLVYFERDSQPFHYFKAPRQTAATRHPRHPNWTQVGDVGRLDRDGYLFLTDRASFLIICGGVNVYPQEIENVLLGHPGVLDAAVFGEPDEELGEHVRAVVQPLADPGLDRDALESSIRAYASQRLAGFKVPQTIELVDRLPRQDTGKLYKRLLFEGAQLQKLRQ